MISEKSGLAPESVWDYPRPPRLEPCAYRVRVEFAGEIVADSTRALRLLETSHPPTYYIPRADVRPEFIYPNSSRSFCEYKGEARYWDIQANGRRAAAAAWSYPAPSAAYVELQDYLAFYSQRVDACFVGDERVLPQQGSFYGGWITSNLTGPFKGGPGTSGW
jgi:uncharacterized protein (DUF427 family)